MSLKNLHSKLCKADVKLEMIKQYGEFVSFLGQTVLELNTVNFEYYLYLVHD